MTDRPQLKLREWRKHRGLTQTQLGEAMGTTKSVISDLEVGRLRWNETHLLRASRALNADPIELFRSPDDWRPPGDLFAGVLPARREEALKAVRALLKAFQNGNHNQDKPA